MTLLQAFATDRTAWRRGAAFCLAGLTAALIAGCAGSSHHPSANSNSAAILGATRPSTPSEGKSRHRKSNGTHKQSTHEAKQHRTQPSHTSTHHYHHHRSTKPSADRRTTSGGKSGSPSGSSHTSHKKRRHKRAQAPPSPPAESVSLRLHAGSSSTEVACGLQHHQRIYTSGSTIKYSGAVKPVPKAQWKVKIKIKLCQNGTYVDYSKFQIAVNKRTGAFTGTFPAPPAGYYEATSRLYVTDVEIAKSLEVHFQIP